MAWFSWFRKSKPAPDPDPVPNDLPHALLAEINRYRASWDIAPLKLDQKLCEQAQHHSVNQAKMGKCSHYSPYGTNPLTRSYMAGYHNPAIVCENIAEGFATPIIVVRSWYRSVPHRANLLSRKCQVAGIGMEVSGSSRYWTAIFVSDEGDTTMASLAGPLQRSGNK